MLGMRKTYDAAIKAKVALEAVKGDKTITQIASEFGVHPNQIRQWRARLLEMLPEMFSQRRPQQEKSRDELEAELYRQIGQLKVELEWLKKKSQKLLSS
jgi:transposase-like protein